MLQYLINYYSKVNNCAVNESGGRMFVGRKKELDALNSRYKSNRKEFGVLYGRKTNREIIHIK